MKHYFNNAGAAIMSEETVNVVNQFMTRECEIGAYAAAQEAKSLTDAFYKNAAKLIGAKDEKCIAFVDSASRGWNLVINGLKLKAGDTVITLSSEFGTNLISLFLFAQKNNIKIKVIKCDSTGKFDIAEIERELVNGANAIAISHVAAQGSIINPIFEIGILAKKYNAIYIVDGCQGVGQLAVNVQEINCDVYMTSGRKWLRAPRGTGFLYVKNPNDFEATELDLASADLILNANGIITGLKIVETAKKFELWEKNIAALLGFSSAIEQYLRLDSLKVTEQISQKANRIREKIYFNKKLKLLGEAKSLAGIIGFYASDPIENKLLMQKLIDANIIFSTISDWDCPLFYPYGVQSVIRLSPHYYTSEGSIQLVESILSSF